MIKPGDVILCFMIQSVLYQHRERQGPHHHLTLNKDLLLVILLVVFIQVAAIPYHRANWFADPDGLGRKLGLKPRSEFLLTKIMQII